MLLSIRTRDVFQDILSDEERLVKLLAQF